MPWTQERSTVNQQVQLGVESTSALGTAVACNKSLRCFSWSIGPNADVQEFGATGRKYTQAVVENSEWTDLTADGPIDYNGIIYLLASSMGSVSAATHGVSATAKDWVFTPPVTGSIVPSTYTLQQGDSSTRAHQVAYGIFTDFSYKGDRKTGFTTSAKGMAQPLSDGISLTSTPTAIALAPLAGKHVNIYLDSTSGGLGTTQLLKVLNVDYSFGGIYGPFYPINRANLGYTAHVDMKPKTNIKLLMEADSIGMTELTYLQSGITQFLRIDAQGLVIDNLQTVTLGTQSSGTFSLTYKGQTASGLAFGATGATVQTALLALSTIGTGNVTVTGGAGGPYLVTFTGTLAQDTTALTGTFTALTTPGNASITQNQSYNKFTHDMAVKVSKPNPFTDSNGVFAEEWEFTVVEDSGWGKAQTFTVTNLLTAL